MVEQAEDWRWSSAAAHVSGKSDGLTDLTALARVHRNWRAMLRHGLEGGDLSVEEGALFERHERTGRPLGDAEFIAELERATGRDLRRKNQGARQGRRNKYCVPGMLCCH